MVTRQKLLIASINFLLNERNKKLCTKVDNFLFGHKLSWATAHFVNEIKMQSKQDLH